MDTQLFTNIDQRGTNTTISRIEVERAWADSVGAADWYERCQLWKGGGGIDRRIIDEARENMLLSTDYAERLQALYGEQQDNNGHKRLMMLSTPTETRIAPSFCDHEHIVDVMLPSDPGGSVGGCKGCGAYLTDDGKVDYIPTDEIEF